MKSLNQALDVVLASVVPVAQTESIALSGGLGRVLARDVVSPIDVPAYDNSQMDGYAGIAVEMNNALAPLPVSQRIPAGHPGTPLVSGTVARIFTGAPIPAGANAVIMQEQVEVLSDGRIKCLAPVAPGQNIRLRAGDLAAGQILLTKGRRLSAADIALCASVGQSTLTVTRQLRVAVFSSGDELRQPGEALRSGQIYDSNRPMIMGLVKGLGAEVVDMGCLPDDLAITTAKLNDAAQTCDVLLTCGGVSVGEEDHIKAAIASLGALDLWKISVKPGKPFAFGRVGKAAFMGMPGNPVAAWVTFALLVRPYLLATMGATASPPVGFSVRAGFDWPKPDSRQEFLRGWIDGNGCAQIHGLQNSGVLSSVTECTGLVEIPASTPVLAGELVRFIPYTAIVN
jgi:molybdopterin molybdotransferase